MHAPLDDIRLDDGTLPNWAWPGAYPMFYWDDRHGHTLCPPCANKEEAENDPDIGPTHYAVNYEDPVLFCDGCSKRIESAYAEDEVEGEPETTQVTQIQPTSEGN